MAFPLPCASPKALPFFFFFLLLSFHFFPATSTDFLVGGEDGWAVPEAKEADRFNRWASHNRFKVNDTIHFKYEKDSVMVVTEEEYKQCLSTRPLFYDNNGDTVLRINRPGLFYFISGVSGHCERGQKMIIKVLESPSPPPPPTNSTTATSHKKNNAVDLLSVSSPVVSMLFMFFVSFLFI